MKSIVSPVFAEPGRGDAAHQHSLVVHRRPDRPNHNLVVFVHGLMGVRYGRTSTWGNFPRFLFEDCPAVDVGIYAYRTLSGRAIFWRSISLEREAEILAHELRDQDQYSSILLVGHSMGGLLSKSAIKWLLDAGDRAALSRIRGLILMGVPQVGSLRVPPFLDWFSSDAQALKAHGHFVTEVTRTFQNHVWSGIDTAPNGKLHLPTWAVKAASDLWVDRLSAGLALTDQQMKTVHGSHASFVKPQTKDDEAYCYVRSCIRQTFNPPIATPFAPLAPVVEGAGVNPSAPRFVHPLLRARDWQDRPEFDQLCDWWRERTGGVCALIGMGGAGKTAIVERFLQVLPGGFPEHPKVSKRSDLKRPTRLFVFSFYDAPNVDSFFAELSSWVNAVANPGSNLSTSLSYNRLLDLLPALDPCLLVLDGLEKVQDDGLAGTALGHIGDSRLRDFVIQSADYILPNVSLLVTSRFRLYDPVAYRSEYCCEIEVDRLRPPEAVQLLRDRGVKRGTDEQLESIAKKEGYHALSVDLMGGYIAHFCEGDPSRVAPNPEDSPASQTDASIEPKVAAIREQERKFNRLAERYQSMLLERDPAALALLQRVCLFRSPIGAKTLGEIFTGEGKDGISGSALAALTESDVEAKLRFLEAMRLVEATTAEEQGVDKYTVHPAVRDGFLSGFDAELARLCHRATRKRMEATLGRRPGGKVPTDRATLDLLEEVVYHAIKSGNLREGWRIYHSRLGGCQNVIAHLNEYERGNRICSLVRNEARASPTRPSSLLSKGDLVILYNDWALCRSELGQLAAAEECYRTGIQICEETGDAHISVLTGNLAQLLMRMGKLCAAREVLDDWLCMKGIDPPAEHGAAILIDAVQGVLSSSCKAALSSVKADDAGFDKAGDAGLLYASILQVIGKYDIARKIVEQQRRRLVTSHPNGHASVAYANLLLAELLTQFQEWEEARTCLEGAHEWGLSRDAKEILCWSALVRAKINVASIIAAPRSEDCVTSIGRAYFSIETGLRIARECGYGIYHIDLLLTRAQLALLQGCAPDAIRDLAIAVDEGVNPPAGSSLPVLLAANDPECRHIWAVAEGRHLRGKAFLIQATQVLGTSRFTPENWCELPVQVRELITSARKEFAECIALRTRIEDPKIKETQQLSNDLERGILADLVVSIESMPRNDDTHSETAK